MTVAKLYYVADPMCSWCWGFAPVLATLRTVLPPTLKVHYIMGGLAPDSNEPMPATVRSYVQNAWRQVEKQTGASFNWEYWEKCRPRRSTYPACRAVLAAAQQGASEAMFNAIQQAYYLAAQNPSDLETLYHLAAQLDLDVKRFKHDIHSPAIAEKLQQDFMQRRILQVREFPSLLLDKDQQYHWIMRGYASLEQVQTRLVPRLSTDSI